MKKAEVPPKQPKSDVTNCALRIHCF